MTLLDDPNVLWAASLVGVVLLIVGVVAWTLWRSEE